MPRVRVAITGAHGVGKSTLAAELAGALRLPELPTPGRTLAGRGLPVNEAATVSSQTIAWLLQFRLEREQAAWVTSRSLIDVWSYTVQAARRGILDTIESAMFEELERAMPFAVSGAYDALIYIAPMIALKADDVRPAGESFQAATDEAIREALDRWDVPHMTVDVRDRPAVQDLVDRLSHSSR
jgi:ABC-type glutathione transport system ATPase component